MAWMLLRQARVTAARAGARNVPPGAGPPAPVGRPTHASSLALEAPPARRRDPAATPSEVRARDLPAAPVEPRVPAPPTAPAAPVARQAHRQPAPAAADGPLASETREPAPVSAPSTPREAWILHGDLPAALYQAGLISTLARRRGLPAAIYAGGFSTLNAVLLAGGGVAAVVRGWEELRHKRLLFDEAVRQIPLLAAVVGTGNRAERFVSKMLDDDALAKSKIDLHLSAGNVYFSPPSRIGGTKVKALALAALGEKTASPRTWAKGIEQALASGATSVLLLGPPRGFDLGRLRDLDERAAELGARVETVPYKTGERPRPLDFLLPGSGVPERLIQDGQRVADAWLKAAFAAA